MRPILFGLLWCLVLLSSCSRQDLTSTKETSTASQGVTTIHINIRLDNDRDLVCGMSLTSSVGDTAHYKDKVFGFCSKGCKDKFSTNPSKYIAAK
jgi:YHS domain-containing protein